jgi:hypothetical protein
LVLVKKLAMQFLHTSESPWSRDRHSPCGITLRHPVETVGADNAVGRNLRDQPFVPFVRPKTPNLLNATEKSILPKVPVLPNSGHNWTLLRGGGSAGSKAKFRFVESRPQKCYRG